MSNEMQSQDNGELTPARVKGAVFDTLAKRLGVAASTPEGADKLARYGAAMLEVFNAGVKSWRSRNSNDVNPWLRVTVAEIQSATLLAYDLDLYPGGPLGGLYFFPQGGVLQKRLSPVGVYTLALRAGQRVKCEVVCHKDRFEWGVGADGEWYTHEPAKDDPFSTGRIIGAYCAVYRATDDKLLRVIRLSEEELMTRREAGVSGTWDKYKKEMRKKAVLGRAWRERAIVLHVEDAALVRELPLSISEDDQETPTFLQDETPPVRQIAAPAAPRTLPRPPTVAEPVEATPPEDAADPVSGEQG